MLQVLGSSQHHQLVGEVGGVAGVTFVGEGRGHGLRCWPLGGCLGLKAGMSQVGENPHVSVIEGSLFCLTPCRGGPWSWAGGAGDDKYHQHNDVLNGHDSNYDDEDHDDGDDLNDNNENNYDDHERHNFYIQ